MKPRANFAIPEDMKAMYRATFEMPGGEHYVKWLTGRIETEIEAAMNEGDAVNSSHRLQRAKGLKEALTYIKVMTSHQKEPLDTTQNKS